jgi:hypothetical protein
MCGGMRSGWGDALRNSLIGPSFGETFFDAENLTRISAWSECFRGFSFSVDGVDLLAEEGRGDIVAHFLIKDR